WIYLASATIEGFSSQSPVSVTMAILNGLSRLNFILKRPMSLGQGGSQNWPNLLLLHRTLEQKPIEALQKVIGQFVDCINHFEAESKGRQDYDTLRGEFEVLFKKLVQYCNEEEPPEMTLAVHALCRSVKRELSHMGTLKPDRNRPRHDKMETNEDSLVCYRRIQNYIQRIVLNLLEWQCLNTSDPVSGSARPQWLHQEQPRAFGVSTDLYRSPGISSQSSNLLRAREISRSGPIFPSLPTRSRDHLLDYPPAGLPPIPYCYYVTYTGKAKRGPCAINTRVDVLNQLYGWTESSNSGSLYWINGMAGTGKTAIAYSLCQKLDDSRKLAASFFCSRWLPECRQSSLIIPSISFQLARFSTPFRSALSGVLKDSGWDLNKHSPDLQFKFFIYQPLLQVEHTLPNHLVVVIDALDECEDKDGTIQLLEVLLTSVSESDLPIKFVLSSRPEPEIQGPMRKQKNQGTSCVTLHELDRHAVKADIKTYLSILAPLASFPRIQQPPEDIIMALVERTGGLFIYAATIISYITDGPGAFATDRRAGRLVDVLESSDTWEGHYYRRIDRMYTLIFQAGFDKLGEEVRSDTLEVLYTILSSPEALTINMVARQPGLSSERVSAALRPFWSVLHVFEGSGTIFMLHPSFSEYMLDPSRSGEYCCNPKIYTQTMAHRCFRILREVQPQFNICRLRSSYVPDNKVPGLEVRANNVISATILYAAQKWVTHLRTSLIDVLHNLLVDLEEFLSIRLLLWMEVMNLKGLAHTMPSIIWQAKEWAESIVDCSAELRALIYDAWQFTLTFSLGAVSNSTPHIYTSMLPFWPRFSPISRCYTTGAQRIVGIKGTAANQRQHSLLAIWNFSTTTRSPVYSPDGTQIAVGVGHNVLLLSALTGQAMLPPLEGHTGAVVSVQFSPDGSRIVSGSLDKTIRLWSTKNGETLIGPLGGQTALVGSIVFSPDGTLIISGSPDDNVSVWDTRSGERLLGPLTGNNVGVVSIKYLSNGQCVAFGISDGSAVLWDTHNEQVLTTLPPDIYNVTFSSADISSDGMRVATASNGGGVYVWDLKTGQATLGPLRAIEASTGGRNCPQATSVSFSPDSLWLASSMSDRNIYLWDAQTGGIVLGPLEGHTDNITSLSFSPDCAYLVSGSYDNTLLLWNVRTTKTQTESFHGHTGSVTSVGFSPDSTRIVSGSSDRTLCVWDTENGEMITDPFENGCSSKTLIAYSPDGTRIISHSANGLILLDQLGNVTLGPIRLRQPVQSAVFSPDGTRVVLASTRNIIQVLSGDTGEPLINIYPPITPRSDWMTSLACSPDGSRIAVGYIRSSLSMHDAYSGELIYGPLEGHNNGSHSLAFSPGGESIVSGSFSTVLVRDMKSGEMVLGPLEGHTGWVNSVEYSPDGTQIVSGARDSATCIWDAQTGKPVLGPVKWHTAPVRSVRYSPDGARVVSGSDDKTIRVTDVRKDSQFLSGSSTPTGCDWELQTDGWVVDTEGRLLVWIPPDLRTSLMWPRTQLLISKKGWLRLDFTDACLGKSWAECYDSE
ncbi:unnamed protein product, partial [Rhizoctonia solani]